MWNRILAVAGAQLSGEWLGERGARLPVAPLLFHGSLALLLCGLARSELGPFPYAIFALSVPLFLTSLPLLGELGPLLRADAAEEWIGAQPVRPFELRAARVLCLAVLLGALALASLLPAAILAPSSLDVVDRLTIVCAGLAQTACVAALILWIQAAFGGRAESVLVLVQTALFAGVIVGAAVGLRGLPALARIEAPEGALTLFPPTWFASLVTHPPGSLHLFALLATALAVVTFAFAPFPPAPRSRSTRSPLSVLLSPLRRLATRFWVKRDERAIFDLVYDALPAERDFVVRTYPLIAVPLAFLLLGASADDPKGEGLLAILLFTPATYLPVLLAHVPATANPEARWLVDTAPLDPATEIEATRKAIFLRFLVPLHVALTAVAWMQGGAAFALRLALPAAAVTFLVMRLAWETCVGAPPLSTAAKDLGSAWNNSFSGVLFTLAFFMTGVAVVTWRFVSTPLLGLLVACGIFLADRMIGRARHRLARPIDGHA